VRRFADAGIRTIMLTGDQRLTADAVARDLGLPVGADVPDAAVVEQLPDDALDDLVGRAGVFSRVSPALKLRIVTALQRRGQIVAMLGDGVNDAAALKRADVGVTMGGRGTDVARETAAVVLTDDRFETIGVAIEEGRVIFDNIRKFVFYLFSCNLAEIFVLLGATLVGAPLPLTPVQILWLNLITDTLPALSLVLEPGEPGVMRRPPRDPAAGLLSRRFARAVTFYALLIALATVAVIVPAAWRGVDPARVATLAFITLGLAQVLHLGNARSRGAVLAPGRAAANAWAIGAVAVTVGLLLLALYWTPLATLLDAQPLTVAEWMVVVPASAAPAVIGQLLKRRRVS
jgi:Ca2+-transporting ATPase